MALGNVLALSQMAGHLILSILSLCIMLPMYLNYFHDFKSHCILFTAGKWREEDGMFDPSWAGCGFCTFPLYTGCFLFVVGTAQIFRYLRMKEWSFLALFLDVVIGICMLATSILSAIMITLGFIVWCENMTERFPSCEISAGQNIIHGMDMEHINTSKFYIEMGTAQFGAWGSFAISVGITVIALLQLINNHQVRNIKVSMYLERQRLVNQHQAQLDGRSTPPLASSDDSDNK